MTESLYPNVRNSSGIDAIVPPANTTSTLATVTWEKRTPAHKSPLCEHLTSAQCVFYVVFMSEERPCLE